MARRVLASARVQRLRQAVAEGRKEAARHEAVTMLQGAWRRKIARRVIRERKADIAKRRAKEQEIEERLESVQRQMDTLSGLAKSEVGIGTEQEVKAMWASYNMECEEKKKELEEKQRQARSALLKKQTAEGTRGGPLGDSEVEEQDDDFKAAKEKLQAELDKLKAARITEGNKMRKDGEKAARDAAAERCKPLEGERKKLQDILGKMRAMTDAMLANASGASIMIDVGDTAPDPAATAKLEEQMAQLAKRQEALALEAEMLERAQDPASNKGATMLQGQWRMKQARREVDEKRGGQDDIGGSRGSRGRGRGRSRSRGGRRRGGVGDSVDSVGSEGSRSSDWTSSDSEDEAERQRRRERRRKKRKRHAERRKLRKMQRAQEKRDKEGLASVSELDALSAAKRVPDIKEGDLPAMRPDAGNMELYGDADDTHEARQLYSRMWARTGEEKERRENLLAKRAATPPKGASGGGGGGGDDSDADSSSDDNSAFASRAFASMGSTSQIVPLNKEMIRQEAESTMNDKPGSMLDEKMSAFEEQKRELLTLQESLQVQLQ